MLRVKMSARISIACKIHCKRDENRYIQKTRALPVPAYEISDCDDNNQKHDHQKPCSSDIFILLGIESSHLKLHLYRLLCRRIRSIQLKEFHCCEVESRSDQTAWKNLDGSVEVSDIAVVEATSGLDLVFRVSQF